MGYGEIAVGKLRLSRSMRPKTDIFVRMRHCRRFWSREIAGPKPAAIENASMALHFVNAQAPQGRNKSF